VCQQGVTNKPVITRQPSWSQIFQGEKITLTCEVQGGEKTDWWYYWLKDSHQLQGENEKLLQLTASESLNREYECMATRRDDSYSSTTWSEAFTVSLLLPNKATLTLQHDRPQLYQGETIALRCAIDGGNTGWEYEWETSSLLKPPNVSQYRMEALSSQHQGEYRCKGNKLRGAQSTDWSNTVTLTVISKSHQSLSVCVKTPLTSWEKLVETNVGDNRVAQVSKGGIYRCRGVRETSGYLSDMSDEATIRITCEFSIFVKNKCVFLIITEILMKLMCVFGEKITLTCEVQGGEKTDWRYYWRRNSRSLPNEDEKMLQLTASESLNGEYECKTRRRDDFYSSTTWSEAFTVSVLRVHPSASLTVNPDRVQHFTSESLSLTCEGNSSQWRLIQFLTDDSLLSFLPPATINGSTYIKNEAPRKAVYWCESGTEFSNAVNISTHSDGVILVSPVYPVPVGESVTLLCVMKTGNIPSDVFFYKNNKLIENERRGEMKISAVSESDEGFYKCQYNGRESAQSWMAVQCKSSAHSLLSRIVSIGCYKVEILQMKISASGTNMSTFNE
uniref:Ig-like domain-containing protein n=1 Tax=Salarias fasciatus TaxID=181472 RepID=A0A672IK10_SALFA